MTADLESERWRQRERSSVHLLSWELSAAHLRQHQHQKQVSPGEIGTVCEVWSHQISPLQHPLALWRNTLQALTACQEFLWQDLFRSWQLQKHYLIHWFQRKAFQPAKEKTQHQHDNKRKSNLFLPTSNGDFHTFLNKEIKQISYSHFKNNHQTQSLSFSSSMRTIVPTKAVTLTPVCF